MVHAGIIKKSKGNLFEHKIISTLSSWMKRALVNIFGQITDMDHANVDDQQILTQLSVMTPRVLQILWSPLKEKFRCMIDDCEDGRLKKGLQLEAAILLLPALFKEDAGLLFEVEGHSQTTPSQHLR